MRFDRDGKIGKRRERVLRDPYLLVSYTEIMEITVIVNYDSKCGRIEILRENVSDRNEKH
jgi:hypothetical protein